MRNGDENLLTRRRFTHHQYSSLALGVAQRRLKRWAVELPAERDESPRRQLGVHAEAEVAGRGARVTENALQGMLVEDAVGARHLVQRVHGFHAELRRQRAVALIA